LINIVHLTTDLGLAGRERVIVDLVNSLQSRGYRPSIICLYESGLWAQHLNADIEVMELHKKRKLDLSVVPNIKKYLTDNKITVLHCHNPGTLLYGLLAAKWAKTQLIIDTEHGFSYRLSWKSRLKDQILYKYLDYMTIVSEKLKNDLNTIYKIRPDRIKTIRNGIQSTIISEDKGTSMKIYGMSDEFFNIGIVGRLVPVKNHRMILEAVSILIQNNFPVRLWIVGSGELHEDLFSYTHQVGIEKSVIFMGQRTDVPRILNALDLFVLCSYSEGLSITLLEAMSAGLPIIATNVGGNSELIEHEFTGILVELNNTKELVGSILGLIKDRSKAHRLGDNARNRFNEYFTVSRMASEIDLLYKIGINSKNERVNVPSME
jgi:glycosyltransferase involved in cell wall biosynthesis